MKITLRYNINFFKSIFNKINLVPIIKIYNNLMVKINYLYIFTIIVYKINDKLI